MKIQAYINRQHKAKSIEEQIWYDLIEMMQEDYESMPAFCDAVLIRLKRYHHSKFDVKVVDGNVLHITPSNSTVPVFKAVEKGVLNA